MVDDPLVEVRNLVKEYKLFDSPSGFLAETILGQSRSRLKRVLDNVSFTVRRGEIVGIIGRNGAGKSTLLKIIAGVLDHQGGSYSVNGRVAAILELGMGFHPEKTGRENVAFGALCLGMRPDEVSRKLDSIIEFSELEDSVDVPYKTLSTGQKMRLGFSTAISVDADLLIVDEALAVGDMLFQEKCFDRLNELRRRGVTILFVSHSLPQIQQLCTRAILLEDGRVHAAGDPATISYEYEQLLHKSRAKLVDASIQPNLQIGSAVVRLENKNASLASIQVIDDSLKPTSQLTWGKRYYVRLTVIAHADVPAVSVGFRVELPSGLPVFGTTSWNLGKTPSLRSGQSMNFDFAFENRLAHGEYLLGGGVSIAESPEAVEVGRYAVVDMRRKALVLSSSGQKPFHGLVDLVEDVSLSLRENEDAA